MPNSNILLMFPGHADQTGRELQARFTGRASIPEPLPRSPAYQGHPPFIRPFFLRTFECMNHPSPLSGGKSTRFHILADANLTAYTNPIGQAEHATSQPSPALPGSVCRSPYPLIWRIRKVKLGNSYPTLLIHFHAPSSAFGTAFPFKVPFANSSGRVGVSILDLHFVLCVSPLTTVYPMT